MAMALNYVRQIRDYDPQAPILFFSGEGFDADKKKGH
jgi:hypothetical protein